MQFKFVFICFCGFLYFERSAAVQITDGVFNSVECLQLAKDGDCSFYTRCLERRLQCEETGYALALGSKLCGKLQELKTQFTSKGQAWSMRFRSCLMNTLFTELYSPKLTCKTVEEIAAHSHAKCLLDGPENFCHIANEDTTKNAGTLLEVIKTAGLVLRARNYGVRQVWEIAVRCNITLDLSFIKAKVIDIRKIDLPSVPNFNIDSVCRGYGNDGDLRFFECLSEKLPFESVEEGNLLSDYFLPLSININRQLSIFNGRGKTWVKGFLKGLTTNILSVFDLQKPDILATLPIDLFNKTMEIMIEQGFCEMLRKNEWALDRGLNLGGYPYIKPRRMLHRPLADRPFDLRTRFYQDLATFRAALSRVQEYCYNLGKTACKTFYKNVQSQKLGHRIFLRCEDDQPDTQRSVQAAQVDQTTGSPNTSSPATGGLKCGQQTPTSPCPGYTTRSNDVDESYIQSCGKQLGCDNLIMVNRSQWGADNTTSMDPLPQRVAMVIIHHTGGDTCNSSSSCKEHVRQLQTDHMDIDGRQDIIYNYLIAPDGSVYEGRGCGMQGEHSPGWNCQSYGIAFIGNYTTEPVSQAAIDAFNNLLLCALSREKLSSVYTVHAASEMAPLYHCPHSSPGNALYQQVTEMDKYTAAPVQQPCNDTTGCNSYQVVSRDEWGAEPPKATAPFPPENTPLPGFLIHHTDGSSCDNQNDCSTFLRNHQRYHMVDKGWDDIGYNFIVGGDGAVYEGRGWDVVSATAGSSNDNLIGIGVIGNYQDDLPSVKALETVDQLISCGVSLGKLLPEYSVFGGRDKTATESPGDTYYYQHIRCMDRFEGNPQPKSDFPLKHSS